MPQHVGYIDGAWNAQCDICGRTFKNFHLAKAWDESMRCEACWEPRHPQDFIRPIMDVQSPPWARPWIPVLADASLTVIMNTVTPFVQLSYQTTNFPTPTLGVTCFMGMIYNSIAQTYEKVKVTARSDIPPPDPFPSTTFSVTRGQLGTRGQAWAVGDIFTALGGLQPV
jgi:hypothetical protein